MQLHRLRQRPQGRLPARSDAGEASMSEETALAQANAKGTR